MDDFVKSPISSLRVISRNFTYARYSVFFEIAQSLILNFLQSRLLATFYECDNMDSNRVCRRKNTKRRTAPPHYFL